MAVFDDPGKLENAVSDLQSPGIDRSNLSFLAHESLAERPVTILSALPMIRRHCASLRGPTPTFAKDASLALV